MRFSLPDPSLAVVTFVTGHKIDFAATPTSPDAENNTDQRALRHRAAATLDWLLPPHATQVHLLAKETALRHNAQLDGEARGVSANCALNSSASELAVIWDAARW
jgi:hypothetical protein